MLPMLPGTKMGHLYTCTSITLSQKLEYLWHRYLGTSSTIPGTTRVPVRTYQYNGVSTTNMVRVPWYVHVYSVRTRVPIVVLPPQRYVLEYYHGSLASLWHSLPASSERQGMHGRRVPMVPMVLPYLVPLVRNRRVPC